MDSKISSILLSSLLVLAVSACSGGGGDDSGSEEPTNQKPTANAGQDITANEQTSITIEGSGTDNDGTISSYSWAQISGQSITLSGEDTANLSFDTPVAKTEAVYEFELTVTDNGGAVGKDTVKVTVTPVNEEKLTISGHVDNNAIKNAIVTTKILGQEYKAFADENGRYILEVSFDEDAETSNELVTLTATGVDEQNHIKLKTAVGSLKKLFDSKEASGIVDFSKNKNLIIDNVSTAILGLVVLANDGVSETLSVDELSQVMLKLDGGEILDVAVAIKLITDYPELISFDSTVEKADMWELLTDKKALSYFLIDIVSNVDQQIVATVWEQTLNSMKEKERYDELPSFYTTVSDIPRVIIAHADFSVTGAGKYIYGVSEVDANWGISNGEISAQLQGLTTESAYVVFDINGVSTEFERNKVVLSKHFSLVKETDNADIVIETTKGFYSYINPRYPNYIPDENFEESKSLVVAKVKKRIEEDLVPSTMMLPLNAEMFNELKRISTIGHGNYLRNIYKDAGSFKLREDKSVYSPNPKLGNGSWLVNGDGELVLSFDDVQMVVSKFREHFMGVTIKDYAGNTLGYRASFVAKRESSETLWRQENVAGYYDFTGSLRREPYSFYLDLKSDGTGFQISGKDTNRNGRSDLGEYSKAPLVWMINDGKLVIDRYRRTDGSECQEITPDCYIHIRRIVDLFEVDGERYYSTNRLQYNLNLQGRSYIPEELREAWELDVINSRSWIKTDTPPLEGVAP